MTNAEVGKLAAELHKALATALLARIQGEEVTAAVLKEAREFLKDNGITDAGAPGSPVRSIAEKLPFRPGDDEPVESFG